MKPLLTFTMLCSLLALPVVGCSSGVSGGGPLSGAASERPVIGKLQTRDRAVTLLVSRDGLHVTVEDPSGNVLARDVPVDELRVLDGITYELFRSSVASRSESGLDARLEVAEPRGDR